MKKLGNGPLGTSYQPSFEVVLPWPRRIPKWMKPNPGGSIRALARGRVLPTQIHDETSGVTRLIRVSTRAF